MDLKVKRERVPITEGRGAKNKLDLNLGNLIPVRFQLLIGFVL